MSNSTLSSESSNALLGWLLDLPRQLNGMLSHPLSTGRRSQVIYRWLAWHVGSRLVPGPVLVPFVNGTSLFAAPGWANVTSNHYVGLAEPDAMAFVAHLARGDDILFDVGANAGVFTVLACAASGCRCVAFEPFPATARMLERNVAINNLHGLVTIRHAAAGSSPGSVRLTSDAGPMNHVVAAETARPGTVDVPVTTLDSECHELGLPTLLKIDVEGYEFAVLAGAQETLRAPALRAIVIEINRHAKRYQRSIDEIFAAIRSHNFTWVDYNFRARALVPVTAPPREGTHLFVRDVSEAATRLRDAPALHGPGFSV
jgi:FkbM family methyltransferase